MTEPGKVIQEPELWLLNHLRGRMPHEPTIVDAGANIGDWTRAVYTRFPDATVFAFEPQAGAVKVLEKLTYPRLRVFANALGSENGEATLRASRDLACLRAGFHRDATPLGDLVRHERVQVVELQSAVKAMGLDHLELLKLDVEGHELDVLLGAAELLDRLAIDLIQFEFNDAARWRDIEFRDLWQLLEFGYSIYHLTAVGLKPLRLVGAAHVPEDLGGDNNFLAMSKACGWI